MEDFNHMLHQAVAIKSHEMSSKRKTFEKQPIFIKAGLYYLNDYKDMRQSSTETRYECAVQLKEKGNELFKEGNLSKATHEYEKSLSIFLYIENVKPNWKNEGILDEDLTYVDEAHLDDRIIPLRIKVLLNLAICYLKDKQYSNAIAACDYVLSKEQNSKALYRRAKTRITNINAEEHDYQLAIEDLEAAQLMDNDQAIEIELKKAKFELKKMIRGKSTMSRQVIQNIQSESIETSEKDTQIQDESDSSESEEYEYSDDWKKYSLATLNQDPSYEEDPNKEIPQEVIELGKFIESRGVTMLHYHQSQGNIEQANKQREYMAQVMQAKVKLERLCKQDFDRPILNQEARLVDKQNKLGIDLNDPLVKEEFKRILQQSLQDLRKYLKEQGWIIPRDKQSLINKVNKLAKKEQEQSQTEEQNSWLDIGILVVCVGVVFLSLLYNIQDL